MRKANEEEKAERVKISALELEVGNVHHAAVVSFDCAPSSVSTLYIHLLLYT